MSFFDNISKMAEGFLGDATPQQAADAASEHVANADPNETADHLTQGTQSMDQPTLASLGQQLLSSYTNHQGYSGDANSATQEAGVSQADVATGNPGAVGTLLQFAKNHPQVLQSAASSFFQNNPGVISKLPPGLVQGIEAKFGGGTAPTANADS